MEQSGVIQTGVGGRPRGAGLAKPVIVIQPAKGFWDLNLKELWQYREMLYFLVWRDVKVRYKQTAIGAAWAILQPLLTMMIFTLIFSYFAQMPSDGLPYSLFAYAGLLPWTYFSQAMGHCSNSVVHEGALISKVYFPRLIIPLAAVIPPLVDFFLSFLILLCLMAWFGIGPSWGMLALPAFLLFAVLTALAVGLWLSALNVKYRDINYTLPFLIQMWMFASPIVYPLSLVPEQWRLLYSLNPIAGIIEGFRWALLGHSTPNFSAIMVSALVVVGLLIGGLLYFRRTESIFADFI